MLTSTMKAVSPFLPSQKRKPGNLPATKSLRRFQPCAIFILFLCGTLLVLRSLFPVFLNVSGGDLLEMNKCPACYGVNMCPAILAGEVKLEPFYQLRVAQALNGRNVYFGKYHKKEVVLKKLGSNSELEALDRDILEKAEHKTEKVHWAIRTVTQKHLHMEFTADSGGGIGGSTVHHLIHPNFTTTEQAGEGNETKGSSLLTCPSQRKLQFVEDKVYNNNCGQNRLTILHNIMTLLLINPEPLVFQAFSAEEGWPFPAYLGACGRLVLEEYVGDSLRTRVASSDFKQRAKFAYQLLQLAGKLTTGTAGFRLYVTDLSLDNIAIANDGSLKIIDGENIVVADLQTVEKEKPPRYNESYSSKAFGCPEEDPDCFSYSEEDLCTRLVNDHNYYAVCRAFLNPRGYSLLANPSSEFAGLYPETASLLEQCYDSEDRMAAARRLQDLLSDYLSS